MSKTFQIFSKYAAVAQCREWVYDADDAGKEFDELRARIAQLEKNSMDSSMDYIALQSRLDAATAENQRLHASLIRIEEEAKGPDQYATWKDAAVAMRAENQRLRADGERLDWLCANAPVHSECDTLNSFDWHCNLTLRDAIDAAKSQQKESSNG